MHKLKKLAKNWLIRRISWWAGDWVKEKKSFIKANLRAGQTPRQAQIEIWSHQIENNVPNYAVQVWYPEIQQHDTFRYGNDQKSAVTDLLLIEPFLGKPV